MPTIRPSSVEAVIAAKGSHPPGAHCDADGKTIDPEPAAIPCHGMQASTPDPPRNGPEAPVGPQEKTTAPGADPPDIDALDAHSDLSAVMSAAVSESFRRQALRKWFHLPAFNQRDGLDDYDGDYRQFKPLGKVVTAHLRHQLARLTDACADPPAPTQRQTAAAQPSSSNCGGRNAADAMETGNREPAAEKAAQGPTPSSDPATMLNKIRTAVDCGGNAVCAFFCSAPVSQDVVRHLQARLPESVLVLPGHRAASGMEVWLAALAMGACRVALLGDPSDPAWQQKLRLPRAILAGLGLDADSRLMSLEETLPGEAPDRLPPLKPFAPATWTPARESRALLWQAVDHLYDQLDDAPSHAPLYPGAPFGKVELDVSKCTLCMACAGSCPTAALSNGSDRPRIRFRERDCSQCGRCRQVCPEQAVSLTPRICYDRHQSRMRVLHQDEPLCCSVCGAPFATSAMIAAITRKLSSHWMYQDPSAKGRLAMCRDCRIRNLYDSRNLPPVHGGPGRKP